MRKFHMKSKICAVVSASYYILLLLAQSLVAQTSGPRAAIVNSNDHVTVSWPVSPLGFALETVEAHALAPEWTAVTNLPTAIESNISVVLPRATNGALFRLSGRASAPLFQFGAFYDLDYECTALPAMTFNGAVHCNGNTYLTPHTGITYRKSLTSAGNILRASKAGNMFAGTGPVTNLFGLRSGTERLGLLIGTNSLREIVEIPPQEEDANSSIGLERFFNKAEMIILVSNDAVRVTSGRFNDFATTILLQDFVTTNNIFYNGREKRTVRVTDVDIGKFIAWKGDAVRNVIGFPTGGIARDVTIIYIADFRPTNSSVQMGIRLRNGKTLPSAGLTIASPHPVYVLGHYNCPNNAHLGTTNTTATAPAAILGDAITILSSAWNDNAGFALSLSARVAVPTTVNAALISGIVQTSTNTGYSGGVENYLRFLEDWRNNRVATFNGSMAVMFESQHAKQPWASIGIYYNPPVRNWHFDTSFLEVTGLPPGTPFVSVIPGTSN